MSLRPPRWLRSVRRRPTAFVALVTLSAFAVIVSTLTPMLLDALATGGLAQRIAALAPPDDGYAVTTSVLTQDQLQTAQNAVDDAVSAAGSSSVWGDPIEVTATGVPVTWTPARAPRSAERTTVSIADDCSGLRLTAGRCPTSTTETAIPASVARKGGFALGGSVRFQQFIETPVIARIVGVYDDRSGTGAVLADPDSLLGSRLAHPVSNPIIGTKGLAGLPYSLVIDGAVRIARTVRPADVPALRAGVANAERTTLSAEAAQASVRIVTGLPDVLASIRTQQAAAVTLTTPIALEALALAWFALAFVMQRTARARAVEWGIGRSRGLSRRTWLATLFLEPVIAIVLGAVLGFAAALGVASATAAGSHGALAAVRLTAPLTLAAAALALAGSLIALVAASARSAALPLDALLRDTTEPRRLSRLALVAQVAGVLAAVAVVWSVLTTRLTAGPQLALALPVLLALVAGVVALRVTVLLVQRVARRPPRSLVGLVAVRGLARAPSVLAAAVLVLVAAALAGYSLELDTVSDRAQTDRADLLTGAPTVDVVRTAKGVSLLDAVRRADPSGRVALAAEEVDSPAATGAERVVAVDTTRIDAISTWRPGWQGVPLARLTPADRHELMLHGSRISVTLAHVRDGADFPLPSGHDLQLDLVVARPAGWTTVPLGPVRDGTLTAAIPCASGCRVLSLDLSDPRSPSPAAWGALFGITRLSTDVTSASALSRWLDADLWRDREADAVDPTLPVRVFADRLPGQLELDAQDMNGNGTAELEPADGPVGLPAIAASRASLFRFAGVADGIVGTDLAGRPLLLQLAGRAPALPRSLTDGVVVDLGQLDRTTDPAAGDPVQEVWLAAGAHPAVLAALAREGVTIRSSTTAAAARADALHTLVPRSTALVRSSAVVAVLLAILALVAAWVIDVPTRRREWLALRLSGIRLGELRRIALVRFVGPSAVAAILGAPVAALTFAITAQQLPLLAGETAGPPLDASPPWLAMVGLAIVFAAATAVIGAIGARIELSGRRS